MQTNKHGLTAFNTLQTMRVVSEVELIGHGGFELKLILRLGSILGYIVICEISFRQALTEVSPI